MRRVRFSAAMSLDGYIAGPNGEFDWIPMGRKSYEAAKAQENVGMPGMAVARSPAETVRALRAEPGKDLWLFGDGSGGGRAHLRGPHVGGLS